MYRNSYKSLYYTASSSGAFVGAVLGGGVLGAVITIIVFVFFHEKLSKLFKKLVSFFFTLIHILEKKQQITKECVKIKYFNYFFIVLICNVSLMLSNVFEERERKKGSKTSEREL